MQTPSAGMIEIAIDQLKGISQEQRDKQTEELHSALGDKLDVLTRAEGYHLGLQVARVILNTNVELQMKDIKAEDIL